MKTGQTIGRGLRPAMMLAAAAGALGNVGGGDVLAEDGGGGAGGASPQLAGVLAGLGGANGASGADGANGTDAAKVIAEAKAKAESDAKAAAEAKAKADEESRAAAQAAAGVAKDSAAQLAQKAAATATESAASLARIQAIYASRDVFADVPGIDKLAEEAIKGGKSVEAFEASVLRASTTGRTASGPGVTVAMGATQEDKTNEAFGLVVLGAIDGGIGQRLRGSGVDGRGTDRGALAEKTAQALGFATPAAAQQRLNEARHFAGSRAVGIKGLLFAYASKRLGVEAAVRLSDDQIFAWATGKGRASGVRGDVGHTASDFPILLLDAMNKSLEAKRMMHPITWDQFCAVRDLKDFRAHNIIRAADVGHWTEIDTESTDDQKMEVSDGTKETITARTFTTQLGITRKMRFNDDLGAIDQMLSMMAQKAELIPEILAHQVIEGVSGTAMADGYELLNSAHANIESAAALSMDSLNTAIVNFETQDGEGPDAGTDYDFSTYTPSVLLVPAQLRGVAVDLYTNDFNPIITQANPSVNQRNRVKGLVRPVCSRILARKSSTAWYLFSDPSRAAIEVGFLNGNRSPTIVQIGNGDPTEINYKGYFDCAAAAKDYKAARKNAGS